MLNLLTSNSWFAYISTTEPCLRRRGDQKKDAGGNQPHRRRVHEGHATPPGLPGVPPNP